MYFAAGSQGWLFSAGQQKNIFRKEEDR